MPGPRGALCPFNEPIRRPREKLGLHEKTRRILLARLDHFPRKGNVVHSTSDFRDVLIDLQKRGVVFYCNRLDNGCYVVPEEIVAGVKDALGIEMTRVGWDKLLDTLTGAQLGAILEDAGLPSGPIPKFGEHRERGCAPSGKARRRRHSGAIPRRRNAAGGAQARSNAIETSDSVH